MSIIANIPKEVFSILDNPSILDILDQIKDKSVGKTIKGFLKDLAKIRSEFIENDDKDVIDLLENILPLLWKNVHSSYQLKGGNPTNLPTLPLTPCRELLGIDSQFTCGFICNFPSKNQFVTEFKADLESFYDSKKALIDMNYITVVKSISKQFAGRRRDKTTKIKQFIELHKSNLLDSILTFDESEFYRDNPHLKRAARMLTKQDYIESMKSIYAFNQHEEKYMDLFSITKFFPTQQKMSHFKITCTGIYLHITTDKTDVTLQTLLKNMFYHFNIDQPPSLPELVTITNKVKAQIKRTSDLYRENKQNIIVGPFSGYVKYFQNNEYFEPLLYKNLQLISFTNEQTIISFNNNASKLIKIYLMFLQIISFDDNTDEQIQKIIVLFLTHNISSDHVNKIIMLFNNLTVLFFVTQNGSNQELQSILISELDLCSDVIIGCPFFINNFDPTYYEQNLFQRKCTPNTTRLILFGNDTQKDCVFDTTDPNFSSNITKMCIPNGSDVYDIFVKIETPYNSLIEQEQLNKLKQLTNIEDLDAVDFERNFINLLASANQKIKVFKGILKDANKTNSTDILFGTVILGLIIVVIIYLVGIRPFITLFLSYLSFIHSLIYSEAASEDRTFREQLGNFTSTFINIITNPKEVATEELSKQMLYGFMFTTTTGVLYYLALISREIIGRKAHDLGYFIQSKATGTDIYTHKYGSNIMDKYKIIQMILWLDIVLNNMSSTAGYDTIRNELINHDMIDVELIPILHRLCSTLAGEIDDKYIFDEDNITLPDKINGEALHTDAIRLWNTTMSDIALKGGRKKRTIKNKKYKNKTIKGGNPTIEIKTPKNILQIIIIIISALIGSKLDEIMKDNYKNSMTVIKKILKPFLKEKDFILNVLDAAFTDYIQLYIKSNSIKPVSKKLSRSKRAKSAPVKSKTSNSSKTKSSSSKSRKRHSAP